MKRARAYGSSCSQLI